MEILTLTKLKERGFPFFWSLPNSNALINGNISLMVTPLLWHWYFDFSVLSRESSFLIWTAFTSGLHRYSHQLSGYFRDCVTSLPPSFAGRKNLAFMLSLHVHPEYSLFLFFRLVLVTEFVFEFHAKVVYHSTYRSPHSRIFPAYPPSLCSLRYSSSSLTAPPCFTVHLHIIFKLKFYCHENIRKKLHWKRKTSCRIINCQGYL